MITLSILTYNENGSRNDRHPPYRMSGKEGAYHFGYRFILKSLWYL